MVTSRLGGGRGLRQRCTLRGFAQAAGENLVRLLHQLADVCEMRLNLLIVLRKNRSEMVDDRFYVR